MLAETQFFYFAAVIMFFIATIEGINLAKSNGKIHMTTGMIIDIQVNYPNTQYISKWAIMRYYADGNEYISENRIVVPTFAEIGDQREIKYYIDAPQELYSGSYTKCLVLLAASAVCLLIGFCIHITTR